MADEQIADAGLAADAGERGRAGAAEEALEDGFGLVVGVVGEDEAVEIVGLDDLSEEGEWIVRAVNVSPYDLLHLAHRQTTMERYWDELETYRGRLGSDPEV